MMSNRLPFQAAPITLCKKKWRLMNVWELVRHETIHPCPLGQLPSRRTMPGPQWPGVSPSKVSEGGFLVLCIRFLGLR